MRADRFSIGTLLCVLVVSAAAIARLILLVQPIGGDPAIYSYLGVRILDGALPDRDVFEQKPPGILYTYAAWFLLAGRSMLTVQIIDLCAWSLTLVAVGLASQALWRDRAVTLTAVALSAVFINPTLQSGFKQVGQAETWIGLLATLALWCTVRATTILTPEAGSLQPAAVRSVRRAALAGLCCGLACVYKFNAVPYLGACAAAWLLAGGPDGGRPGGPESQARPPYLRLWGGLVAGFAAPLVVMIVWFAASGGLGDLYESTVLYNLRYAGDSIGGPGFAAQALRITSVFATTNVLWLAGILGVVVLLARAVTGDRRGLPLVAMLAASYAAILLNAKFYPQYFLQVLPLLAIAAGCWLVHAVETLRGPRLVARVAAVAALLLVCSPLVRHTAFDRLASHVRWAIDFQRGALSETDYFLKFGGYGDGGDFSLLADVRLARALRESTAPEETVYIYGGEALVLFLADRRSPSRFIWNDPFLTGGFAGRYTHADLIRELEAARTPIVIVLKNDANLIDPRDSRSHFAEAADLRAYVAREYDEVGALEDFLVFARKGHRAPRLDP